MNSNTIIEINNISKTIDSSKIIENISFEVKRGETLSILGPTGCGKTTLLKIIAGLVNPTEGTYQTSLKLGMVFQNQNLFPWKTVEMHIDLPSIIEKNKSNEQIKKILKLFGLEEYWNYYPSKLSGGMKQKVALAMAFAFNPDILLMDEPFSSLDEITKRRMYMEFMNMLAIQKKTIKSFIYVTHSIEEALYFSQRILIMSNKPMKIRKILNVGLPWPRKISVINTLYFFNMTNKIRGYLE